MPPPSVCCSVGSVHAKERADANEWEAIARSPENLGGEVASGLINAFNETEAVHRSEFQELRQDIARLETRLVEFRAELKQDIAVLRSDLKQDIAGVRQSVAGVQSELIKWTFVFWLGTIGIVMLLLRYFTEAA